MGCLQSVRVHPRASDLNKEPLMIPRHRVMSSAFTIAGAGMPLPTTRACLLIQEATRDVAP